jgi:hypothetical protein
MMLFALRLLCVPFLNYNFSVLKVSGFHLPAPSRQKIAARAPNREPISAIVVAIPSPAPRGHSRKSG